MRPSVWPTRTLYCSLDVISLITATELRPFGSNATATSFRSDSRGRRSDVVSSETNGSRRPSASYWYSSRLIRTLWVVSAVAGAGRGVVREVGAAAGAAARD